MDKDFGPYELRDRIGKGGMAWVYLATQKNLDRPVALKILFPHLAEDEKLVARFQLGSDVAKLKAISQTMRAAVASAPRPAAPRAKAVSGAAVAPKADARDDGWAEF